MAGGGSPAAAKAPAKPATTAEAPETAADAIRKGAEAVPKKAGLPPDGSRMGTDEVLTKAENFLGEGYAETKPGRFVSKDGTHVVRMGENDMLGKHGDGPHVNFETLKPNPDKPGKMMLDKKSHVYYED